MEKMLVVVFDTEKQAYEGSHALNELDREGSIAIHAESIVAKNADGFLDVKKTEDEFPIRTLAGTAMGSLIGLLAGPVAAIVGASIGTTAGFFGDVYAAGVSADFLADVSARLTFGKFAVVADVSEEWVTPVDITMERFGGFVFRNPKAYVEAEQRARDIAAMRAEIEELKAEHAQARAELKGKIQNKIDNLKAKLHNKVDQAKQRAENMKNESDAKVRALQQKALKAHQENKAAIESRIAEIRKQYQESEATLRHATAEQLRKAAAQLEKAS